MSASKARKIGEVLPTLKEMLHECCLCGHRCGVDRLRGESGFCRTEPGPPERARVSSHTLHFGEEPMLVGRGGSGTVFFSHCNLRCVFCQNHEISQEGLGGEMERDALADVFRTLQMRGAENINLVTPTHYVYPILLALRKAYRGGLDLPIVYNTNGYDSIELLACLEGIVDVYLPDMKYMDAEAARRYSSAREYPATAKAALKEMYRQVGAVREHRDVATRGLIIRHLVLPNNLSQSYDFLLWLEDEGMTDVTLSLMSQYSPQYRAREFPELSGRISMGEYRDLVDYALKLGIEHLLTQGLDSTDYYLPDFRKDEPFTR